METLIVFVVIIAISVLMIMLNQKNAKYRKGAEGVEYKRECNKCHTIWYSSKAEEYKLGKQKDGVNILALGGLDAAAQVQRTRNAAGSSLSDLKRCPQCKSIDYAETEENVKSN